MSDYFHSPEWRRAMKIANMRPHRSEELNPALARKSIQRAVDGTDRKKADAEKRARTMRRVRL